MRISDWSSDVCSSDLSNLSAIVVFLAKNYRSRASVDGAQDTSLSADGLPARTGDIVCRRSETCLQRGFRGGDLLGGGFGAPGRIGENPALSLGLVLMEHELAIGRSGLELGKEGRVVLESDHCLAFVAGGSVGALDRKQNRVGDIEAVARGPRQ